MRKSLILMSLLAMSVATASFADNHKNKANGESCVFDGQCLSGECKKFHCIALDDNSRPTGNDTIESLLDQFDAITPMINQAGFSVKKLRVDVRFIPVVSVYMRQDRKLSKSKQRQLLKQSEGNLLLLGVLKALFSAHSFSFSKYQFTESILQLNPPKATIFLERK
jgi:hypothetical protein